MAAARRTVIGLGLEKLYLDLFPFSTNFETLCAALKILQRVAKVFNNLLSDSKFVYFGNNSN
jgi:hypothetical protein